MIARERFVSADGNGADNFIYFVRDYHFDPDFHYEAGLRSSEQWLFRLSASLAHRLFDGRLDIRLHGLLHLALICSGLAFGAAATSTLPWSVWLPVWLWAILVTGDVAYSAYLNSFYMDAAALAGIVLCLGSGAHLLLNRRSGAPAWIAYGAGFLLTVGFEVPARAAGHSAIALPVPSAPQPVRGDGDRAGRRYGCGVHGGVRSPALRREGCLQHHLL